MSARPPIQCMHLVSHVVTSMRDLQDEFPTVRFFRATQPEGGDATTIDEREWRTAETFCAFDEAVEASSSAALAVRGVEVEPAAYEILTRFQRFLERRNDASRTQVFEDVLDVHRALHDCDKPLVKADLDHSIDTWQWMLRLSPDAGIAVQLAALFHDIERLESEPERRIEHHAPDYQAFKDAHARAGADRAYEVLVRTGVGERDAARACAIIASHERRGSDADVDLLNDADGLSFFSLNSAGYADYFGPQQTRKKIAYTLARLGPRARKRLSRIRLRGDVRMRFAEAMNA